MNFSDIIKTGQQFAQKAAQPKRPAGGVRRRNETRGQFKNRMGGQSDNSDITELFKGIQQTRTRVHKGMDGNPIDPNAPKGLDKLYADNPHLRPSAGLQAQNNWQARDAAGAAAVARKKAEQEAARNPYGNVVTAPNGSRGVTNSMGQIVGTTAPVGDGSKRVFDDATGKMVPMDQWFGDRNVVQKSKGMTPSPVAQAWNTAQTKKPDSMDLLFSGKPQSSPPGGAQAGMVGPPAPQGAPGGELFGQMPEFRSSGMAMPQQPPQAALPNDLGSVFAQQSRQKYFNPTQLSTPLQATFDQAQVKRDLNAMDNMQFRMADFYPGSDYARLEQMFPGFKFDNYATTNQALDALRQLLSMYQ